MEDYIEFKKANYGKKICAMTEDGPILFDPDEKDRVVGAEKMSYDEYLDVQLASLGQTRGAFSACYFNIPLSFKGQIERIKKERVCFRRIFVSGMYPDGGMFDDKEDHVWMSRNGFEAFGVGDCVEFGAEVYRYVKTGHGKQIDYGLRDPQGIRRIPDYELPSDEELMIQEVNAMICETCFLADFCNGFTCMRPKQEISRLRREMMNVLTSQNE